MLQDDPGVRIIGGLPRRRRKRGSTQPWLIEFPRPCQDPRATSKGLQRRQSNMFSLSHIINSAGQLAVQQYWQKLRPRCQPLPAFILKFRVVAARGPKTVLGLDEQRDFLGTRVAAFARARARPDECGVVKGHQPMGEGQITKILI